MACGQGNTSKKKVLLKVKSVSQLQETIYLPSTAAYVRRHKAGKRASIRVAFKCLHRVRHYKCVNVLTGALQEHADRGNDKVERVGITWEVALEGRGRR